VTEQGQIEAKRKEGRKKEAEEVEISWPRNAQVQNKCMHREINVYAIAYYP
jgi:hypothetical protein